MAPYIHVFISMISVQYFPWSYPTVFYAHSSIPLIDLITSAANFLYYRVSLIASCTISMTTAIITKQHTHTHTRNRRKRTLLSVVNNQLLCKFTTNKQCRYRFPHYHHRILLYFFIMSSSQKCIGFLQIIITAFT